MTTTGTVGSATGAYATSTPTASTERQLDTDPSCRLLLHISFLDTSIVYGTIIIIITVTIIKARCVISGGITDG